MTPFLFENTTNFNGVMDWLLFEICQMMFFINIEIQFWYLFIINLFDLPLYYVAVNKVAMVVVDGVYRQKVFFNYHGNTDDF